MRSDTSPTRDALLEAASTLLAGEGPGALTVRRIAQAAGTSTMGVYSHFGGKDGVIDALLAEGFGFLLDSMRKVRHTDDPLADLRRCGRNYREMALAHPTHYRLMFDRAVPDFEPTEQTAELANSTLALLEERVQRCLDTGEFDPGHGDATEVAHSIWATCHGLVALELAGIGHITSRARRYDATLDALVDGLCSPVD